MIPMCNSSGVQQGWAIATAECDGDVTLEYYNTSGVLQGGTLPSGWQPCVQGVPGPAWAPSHTDIAYAASVDIDLSDTAFISIDNISGNLTLTGSGYTAGVTVKVRLVESGGSSRTISFPAAWHFVGPEPTNIGANKTALLELSCFGPAATDTLASYLVEV
jgi:hypothetical protein